MLLLYLLERQFKQLTETVRQSIKTLPRPNSYEWKSVQGCAVMGSDMLWYRGEVVEVLGQYVKVSIKLERVYVFYYFVTSECLWPGPICGPGPVGEHPSRPHLPCTAV